MAQMTTLLEKMCQNQQPTDTVRPPGGKRKTKRNKSQSPTGSDSDSGEEYASSSNKRQRSSRDNDNVSLYASDSLDGDDLKALTERNKVTDQKGRESKSQNPILQNLAESFEDDDTGEKIDTDLANRAIKRWAKKFNPEKIKGLGEKYKRPENCKDLKQLRLIRRYGVSWAQSRERPTCSLLTCNS